MKVILDKPVHNGQGSVFCCWKMDSDLGTIAIVQQNLHGGKEKSQKEVCCVNKDPPLNFQRNSSKFHHQKDPSWALLTCGISQVFS